MINERNTMSETSYEDQCLALFPGSQNARIGPSGNVKIKNLGIDALPQGKRLKSGMSFQSNSVAHIVEHDGYIWPLHVGSTFPGEPGGEAYAVISEPAKIGTRAADDILASYDKSVAEGSRQDMPKDLLPTIKNCQEFLKNRPEPMREPLLYGETAWNTSPSSP